jgi:hypothetical protein
MDRDNFPVTRRYVRIAVNIPVTLILEPEGKKIKYPCSMLDVADGGVKLWAEVPVSVGQIVDVVPAEGPKFTVRSRVVWVGEPGSEQENRLGLEFLRPVPTTSWGLTPKPEKRQ